MPPEDLLASRMTLAPSLRLVRSDWPVHAIWAFNMEDGPKPTHDAQSVLVTRPEFDPIPVPINAADAAFVAALLAGDSFEAAHSAGTQINPEFDLSAVLGALIAGQAIIKITPGEP